MNAGGNQTMDSTQEARSHGPLLNTSYGGKRLYGDMVEQAVTAERLGYRGITLPEHHLVNVLLMPSPLQMAIKVACETDHLEVVTSVEEVMDCLKRGQDGRVVAPMAMNARFAAATSDMDGASAHTDDARHGRERELHERRRRRGDGETTRGVRPAARTGERGARASARRSARTDAIALTWR